MAFSFGPFVGFWSAFDAAIARGCLVVPGGGMTRWRGWNCCARRRRLSSSARRAMPCTWPKSARRSSDRRRLARRSAADAGRRAGRLDSGRPSQHRQALECRSASIMAARPKSARGAIGDCWCPWDVRERKSSSLPSSCSLDTGAAAGRGRAFRVGAHEFGPRRLSGDPLSHGRSGPARRGSTKAPTGSCCSTGACWAASTTC